MALSDYSTEELQQMAEAKKQQDISNIASMFGNTNQVQQPEQTVAQPPVQQDSNIVTDMLNAYMNSKAQQSAEAQQPVQPDRSKTISDILGQVKQGYADNRDNGFALENLQGDATKTGWNRFGEALGTTARMASNPLIQGIAAGAIQGKVSGDWGKGLEYGLQYAQNKAKSDQYERMMGRRPSILGGYGTDDYKAQVEAAYKNNRINIENQKAEAYERNINSQIEQRAEKLKIDLAKLNEQIRHNKAGESAVAARLGISREKAKAYIDHVKWQEKHGGKTAKQNADMANQRFKNAMTYINTLPEGEEKQAAYQEAYQKYQDAMAFNEDDDLFEED